MKMNFIGNCSKMFVVAMMGICLMSCDGNGIDLERARDAMQRGDSSVAIKMAHKAIDNGDIAVAKTIQSMLKNYEKKGIFSNSHPFFEDAAELHKEIQSASLKMAEKNINEGDFTSAYRIADELKDCELNKRILTNEIASIISENAGDAAARIILIIKERARYNEEYHWNYEYNEKKHQYEMLQSAIEVARANGNKDIVDKLEPVRDEWKGDLK